MSSLKTSKNIAVCLAVFSIFVLSVGLVSALSLSTPSDLSEGDNSTILTIDAQGETQNITLTLPDIVSGSNLVKFDLSPTSFTDLSSTDSLTVSINEIVGEFEFGEYSTTLSATGTNSSGDTFNATTSVTYVESFCNTGEVGSSDFRLEIKDVQIDNDGDGDDEEWELLDDIVVEVEVENTGNEDVDEVIVELALFDSSGDDVASDLDFDNSGEEEIDLGDIRDGDEETAEFRFKVPGDFDNGNYKLAVKAYSDEEGEEVVCVASASELSDDFFEQISVDRKDSGDGEGIAFDNLDISPEPAACGNTVGVTVDVYNVGDEDEDQVKVNLAIPGLGIDLSREITSELKEGEDDQVSFTFNIPSTAEDKTYTLELDAEYDYRNDIYREVTSEEESFPFQVIGCSFTGGSGGDTLAGISASLDSDAEAGEALVVRSTITNFGDEINGFVISASGYSSWADDLAISSQIVTLSPGQSQDVTFTFDVKDDVSGSQSFLIEASADGQVETREVEVNIEGTSSGALQFDLGNSGLAWTIGIINVILIILIIVVAVKVSRR